MEPDEELNSFPYCGTIAGVQHNYRITQSDEKYGVERNGVVIAEIAHQDNWQQLTGEPLSADLLESICERIEAYYC